jgi:hypothetical protein
MQPRGKGARRPDGAAPDFLHKKAAPRKSQYFPQLAAPARAGIVFGHKQKDGRACCAVCGVGRRSTGGSSPGRGRTARRYAEVRVGGRSLKNCGKHEQIDRPSLAASAINPHGGPTHFIVRPQNRLGGAPARSDKWRRA